MSIWFLLKKTLLAATIFGVCLNPCFQILTYGQPSTTQVGETMTTFRNPLAGLFPPDISADGRWIAYSAGNDQTNKLWVVDVDKETSRCLTPNSRSSRAPVWSPNGKLLAFYSEVNGTSHLFVWNRVTDEMQAFPEAEVSPPSDFSQLWSLRPAWSPNGRYIFYAALPNNKKAAPLSAVTVGLEEMASGSDRQTAFEIFESEKAVEARLARSVDVKNGTSTPGRNKDNPWAAPSDLVMAVVDQQKVYRLLTGTVLHGIFPSPDGRSVAVTHETGLEQAAAGIRQFLFRLYVSPIPSDAELGVSHVNSVSIRADTEDDVTDWRGKKPTPLVNKLRQWLGRSVSWSPDSKTIAYTTSGALATGDVFLVDVNDGVVHNLTEQLKLGSNPADEQREDQSRIANRKADFRGKFGQSYEPPLWTRDGSWLLCLREEQYDQDRGLFRRDIWMIPTRGASPRHLIGGSDTRIESVLRSGTGYLVPLIDNQDSVFVRVRYLRENQYGFGRVDLQTGNFTAIVREPKLYSPNFVYADSASAETAVVLYQAESSPSPTDLWLLDLRFTSPIPRRVTHLNPHLENRNSGSTKKLDWRTKDGLSLSGVLLLPPTAAQTNKVPLIAWVYGGIFPSLSINAFAFGSGSSYEPRVLVSRGYAVLLPDMPIRGSGTACDQITDDVLPGLDAAIATGYVDGERLGLIGHSFGGYSTNCLITRTMRFKAAVSLAGLSDLISMYLSQNSFGTGQAQLGSTLWENRERYINNSPVFHLEKVETPLLLMHGLKDRSVPPEQSNEMYYGLRSLNKEVVLIKVKNGDHYIYTQPGVWEQIFRWFDEFLMKRKN